MTSYGSLRSILKAALSMLSVLLPTASETAPEAILTAAPSFVPLDWLMDLVRSPVGANPDPPSVAVKVFVTAVLYQPLVPSALAVGPSLTRAGAFLST